MAAWRFRPLRAGFVSISQIASALNYSAIQIYNDDNQGRLLSILYTNTQAGAITTVNAAYSQPAAPSNPTRAIPFVAGGIAIPGAFTTTTPAALPSNYISYTAPAGITVINAMRQPLFICPVGWALTIHTNAINTAIALTLAVQADDPDILDDFKTREFPARPS